ncbi:MAG: SRPBCC family protein [Gaiellaceae bacterium]
MRPRLLRWGTTGDELDAALVGDELIARANLSSTRAITIHAPAETVWPWIAQLGQGRGGFYSYDVLENLVGCDIQSADRIVAEWQNVRAGDEVRLAREVGLAVAVVEPERSLVLHGGIEMGKTAPPFDFTWSFTLRPLPDETTRLIVRERYAYTKPWARLVVEPTQVLSFVMSRKMLRGIKDRAENTAGQSRDRHVQDVGG